MLFSFCYLYFLQGDILAEAQYVFSKGVTTYSITGGAIIISLILQVVQWIVALLSRLPARWHALSYFPSALMLAILSCVDRETIEVFSFGVWVWLAPLALVAYVVAVLLIRAFSWETESDLYNIKSQIYPNFILLFLFILGVGAVPQSSDVYHYELKTERLLLDGQYEEATKVGERSLCSSVRLTQLRMYALSEQDLLAERMFDYPQYYGSKGLLDVTDTLSVYRFSPQCICRHLGAYSDPSVHSTERYYQLVLGDSIWNEHTVDYYLCSLLLDKKLNQFKQELPRYYNLADSIEGVYDGLPRAYREALLLIGQRKYALDGKVVVGADTLTTFTDYDMIDRFRDYNELKSSLKDKTELINRTRRQFGNTYWWYYDFGYMIKGE